VASLELGCSTRRVDVGGHALRVETRGAGPPHFVCLHGLADTLAIWSRLLGTASEASPRVAAWYERIACAEIEGDPRGIAHVTRSVIIQRHIPGAELAVIPGRGHWLHVEAPDLLLDIVHRFCQSRLA